MTPKSTGGWHSYGEYRAHSSPNKCHNYPIPNINNFSSCLWIQMVFWKLLMQTFNYSSLCHGGHSKDCTGKTTCNIRICSDALWHLEHSRVPRTLGYVIPFLPSFMSAVFFYQLLRSKNIERLSSFFKAFRNITFMPTYSKSLKPR